MGSGLGQAKWVGNYSLGSGEILKVKVGNTLCQVKGSNGYTEWDK